MNNCSDNGTQPEAANFTEQSPDNHDKSYDKVLVFYYSLGSHFQGRYLNMFNLNMLLRLRLSYTICHSNIYKATYNLKILWMHREKIKCLII